MKKTFYLLLLLTLVLQPALLVLAQQQGAQNAKPAAQTELEIYRSAMRITDPAERLTALRKFLADNPNTTLAPAAKLQIFKALVATGAPEKEFLPLAEEVSASFTNPAQRITILNDIAYNLAEAGKGLDLALKYAEEANTNFPANGEAERRAALEDTLGWVHFKRGNYAEAVKFLEKATKSSEEAGTFEHLAQAYEKLNKPEPAIDAYITAVALTSNEEKSKDQRRAALTALYSKKHGSTTGLDALIADRRLALLKERALVKARYEAQSPKWELKNIKGELVRSADLAGKVVVLDWWGSWCPPCRLELPHFQKLYETYKDKGVVFIGMNWERPGPAPEQRVEIAKKFLADNAYTFPVIIDHDMFAGNEFKVEAFPTVFVIDRGGQIRYRLIGFSPDVAEILDLQIKTELARPGK